jgi:hypothetical protein
MNLLAGWIGVLAGVISGSAIGLFFHDDRWLGGYDSFARRMLRLGHISFFGLGFVNIAFALTVDRIGLAPAFERVASVAFLIGAIAMPACCLLAAWRKPLRHLFPVPVLAVAVGVVSVLVGWGRL